MPCLAIKRRNVLSADIPWPGKEHSGLENAEAKLFLNAVWLLVPQANQSADKGKIKDYCELLERIGVRILKMDAERHDLRCAHGPATFRR